MFQWIGDKTFSVPDERKASSAERPPAPSGEAA
jgi:hypothetical protein